MGKVKEIGKRTRRMENNGEWKILMRENKGNLGNYFEEKKKSEGKYLLRKVKESWEKNERNGKMLVRENIY